MKVFTKIDIIGWEAADQLVEQILLCSPEGTAIMILSFLNFSEISPVAYREKFSNDEKNNEVSTKKFISSYYKAFLSLKYRKSTKCLLEDVCLSGYYETLHITPGGILIPPKDIDNYDWEDGCNRYFPCYSGAIGVSHLDNIQDHEIAIKGLRQWAKKVFKKR